MEILLQLLLVLNVILLVVSLIQFLKLFRKKDVKKRNIRKAPVDPSLLQLDIERRSKRSSIMKWFLAIRKLKGFNSGYRYRREINLSDFDYQADNILENDA